MREYINGECQVFLEEAGRKWDLVQEFYQLLEENYHPFSQTQYHSNIESMLLQTQLIEAMRESLTQLTYLEQRMIDTINQEREGILRELEDITDKIDTIEHYASLTPLHERYVFTNRHHFSLESLARQL